MLPPWNNSLLPFLDLIITSTFHNELQGPDLIIFENQLKQNFQYGGKWRFINLFQSWFQRNNLRILSSLHFLLLSWRSGIPGSQPPRRWQLDIRKSLLKVVICVWLEIHSAHHFISDVRRMKMAIFVKFLPAVAKDLASLTKINVVHVFPSSNVLAALIILLEHVTATSVQEDSMMFLESGLTLSALSHLVEIAPQNMATVKVMVQVSLPYLTFQFRWLSVQCGMRRERIRRFQFRRMFCWISMHVATRMHHWNDNNYNNSDNDVKATATRWRWLSRRNMWLWHSWKHV